MQDKPEIKIAFTKDDDYWYDRPDVKQINSLYDLKLKVEVIGFLPYVDYIGFISGFGILFEFNDSGTHLVYSYKNPTPDVLEYLCEGKFFGRDSNAKMWYSAFMYSIENKDCLEFWHKYKDTIGGIKFMSLVLGSKTA